MKDTETLSTQYTASLFLWSCPLGSPLLCLVCKAFYHLSPIYLSHCPSHCLLALESFVPAIQHSLISPAFLNLGPSLESSGHTRFGEDFLHHPSPLNSKHLFLSGSVPWHRNRLRQCPLPVTMGSGNPGVSLASLSPSFIP